MQFFLKLTLRQDTASLYISVHLGFDDTPHVKKRQASRQTAKQLTIENSPVYHSNNLARRNGQSANTRHDNPNITHPAGPDQRETPYTIAPHPVTAAPSMTSVSTSDP